MTAPLVFVGYGASEPKLGYDDYAGVDVKGKIVVIVNGSPDKFSSSVSAHTRNAAAILKAASDHGAIGVLVASTDTVARGGRGGAGGAARGVNNIVDEKGNVVVSRTQYGSIDVYGTMGGQLFNMLARKKRQKRANHRSAIKSRHAIIFRLKCYCKDQLYFYLPGYDQL